MTLSDKFVLAEGRPSGFDFMRFILSIAVVCQHSMNTTMGINKTLELLATPLRAPVAFVLAAFFGLSGFLVTGSLLRSESLISFLGLRVLRLGPALAVEVLLSAGYSRDEVTRLLDEGAACAPRHPGSATTAATAGA